MYHVFFAIHETWIGQGKAQSPSDKEFSTFEEAKKCAIDDLSHWRDEIDARISRLQKAKTFTDLSD